ncbi:hypothetical protein AZE42_08299 [Rhizopogon vesiculosus]|uniref:Uncharacterized protein n=1 Tax=Rhizopogon vesiculosus TaxID=180088 RepID=A0A1J8Q5X1_9AGAM|nr:hypothetical protein AZE42_08299 [Rhizopogon vesiculosus]
MSSTLPAPTSSNPAHRVHSPNLEGNNCTSQHSHIFQPQNTYPSPPTSHATSLQESLPMNTLCLPPFWETPCDCNLTITLIHAQYSEHRAESRLVRKRLRCIKIEQELYGHMEEQISHRLHKADNSIGIAHGSLHSCGLFPVVGKTSDYVDSDLESGAEASS